MTRIFLLLLISFLLPAPHLFAQTLSAKDLGQLTGDKWHGILTYKNYQNGKEVNLPVELTVTEIPNEPLQWNFQTDYPTEKHASGKQVVQLSKDGRQLDKETVVERKTIDGKLLQIITEEESEDNDKKATLRHTYQIGKKEFSQLKEVRFAGEKEFIFRNRYHYQR
jgi:hypothetical protein